MLAFLLLVILSQWAPGAWLLPVLRRPTSATPLGWALFAPCVFAFIVSKVWMFRFFGKHRASPMFKEHAKELITDGPLSFLLLAIYVVPREEKRLLLTHGADHEAHKARITRWGVF